MPACRLFQIQEHVLRPRLKITVMNSLRNYVEWEANVLGWNWDRSSSTNNTITITIATITPANATQNDTSPKLQLPPPSEIQTFITILSPPIKLRQTSVLLAGLHSQNLHLILCLYMSKPMDLTDPTHAYFWPDTFGPITLIGRARLDYRVTSQI